ncbi:hypothetical protein MLD38_029752 [Melastoma candidum]|uniref:Uncharacterized protein n=1 Tax=Melastoma candidum TaxID=119954 RepID=A0ACB9N5T7_9MYRT|nr:hypothetical protein MLD38_029752 [Melastoma candidum]
MVGPKRPQFILFGSSIVQFSFGNGGWGASLADLYSRKADILLRGYAGWNSRRALEVLNEVFPKDSTVQPALAIVYFGGNDSVKAHPSGLGPHVPLPEYIENMRKIAAHIQNLSEKTRLIFLTAPPINEDQILEAFGGSLLDLSRTNELCKIYSDACLKLCEEMNIKAIDLWTAIQRKDDWKTTCFTDGIHFTSEGSKIVAEEILSAIKESNWEPSLHWELMPSEFEQEMETYPKVSPPERIRAASVSQDHAYTDLTWE